MPPGVRPSRMSPTSSVCALGTNASSTTTVLLPVPRMPLVCQVSRTVNSWPGTRNSVQSGGPASVGIIPPMITRELWLMPLR